MDNFSHEKEITKEMIEEFIQSHKDRVNEAIKNKSPVFIYGL